MSIYVTKRLFHNQPPSYAETLVAVTDNYIFKWTPYIRLKSLRIGWRADSVPWVVYIGPWIVGGGTILYTPDLHRSTLKPNRSSSAITFFMALDWCCFGTAYSPYIHCSVSDEISIAVLSEILQHPGPKSFLISKVRRSGT